MANYGIQFKDKNGNNYYPCPFPIGAVYISVNNINPKSYFGGTWERVSGGFLYGRTDDSWMNERGNGNGTWTNEAGSGTTYNHSLTEWQLPQHRHYFSACSAQNLYTDASNANSWNNVNIYAQELDGSGRPVHNGTTVRLCWEQGGAQSAYWTGITGKGEGHSHNLPNHAHNIPYFACYLWKRIA